MGTLQPLYAVKERLEQAAIAGTGLLGEDFRLKRAAEALKPLAQASPVFGRIDAGLERLLAAEGEQRPGLLLDLLALVDAVAYTQAETGAEGELEPLPTGGGQYQELSFGQLAPLLTALTSTGGGRLEVIRSAWENHPAFFSDFRLLPALVRGLGDSYGEIAELNMKILKRTGKAALPLLKEGFDPAGNRAMARRVEVIAAVGGEEAAAWLREILPEAKKDVRTAVITALGEDPGNAALLLELAGTERGGNREAALKALALQDGEDVRAFWEKELMKHGELVKLLAPSRSDWSIDLVSGGLRARLESLLQGKPAREACDEAGAWCRAIGQKDSPVMLEFWRWAEAHMEAIDQIRDEKGQPPFLGVQLTDRLTEVLHAAGPGPLREFCLRLWDRHPKMSRYLGVSFQAALLSLPAREVYKRYGPLLLTKKPLLDAEGKKTLHTVLLRALGEVRWSDDRSCYLLAGTPTAEPLDRQWFERLVRLVWRDLQRKQRPGFLLYGENLDSFDALLMDLTNPGDRDVCRLLSLYARARLLETEQPYAYSRWMFRMGASPKGVLGIALAKRAEKQHPGRNYLYHIWTLMSEAAKALPSEETAELLEEILKSNSFRKEDEALARRALPWTVEQLRAGRPFPEWDEWWKLR